MKICVLVLRISLAATLCLSGCYQAKFDPWVSLSQDSPDRKYVAKVVEIWVPERDRRFEVRVTRKDVNPQQVETIYHSPDEGRIAERFLWSKDSHYVLLVGRNLATGPESLMDTREVIYLLYGVESREVRCNSSQLEVEMKSFDFNDLVGIDFGEKFKSVTNVSAGSQNQPL